MAVYVDDMRARVTFGSRVFCFSHMVADTLDELHEMADRIGVQRRWFQDKASFPHYDITQSKKALALEHGAVAITWKELGYMIRAYRRTGKLELPMSQQVKSGLAKLKGL